MAETSPTAGVLDREFLTLRGKIVEVAAALDRIARAGFPQSDPRMAQLLDSLDLLASREPATDRAARVQMAFSIPYDPEWREKLGVRS